MKQKTKVNPKLANRVSWPVEVVLHLIFLAFSIACLVDPDILILDEVLSVGDGAFRKKSGDKMRAILNSGVTGILVSHSVPQVRELCNKILWLDHGRQVAFTEDVDLYLDAYEEFLITKALPKSEAEVRERARAHQDRLREEKRRAELSEAKKLEAILEAGESKAALEAALSIVRKHRPDLLRADG